MLERAPLLPRVTRLVHEDESTAAERSEVKKAVGRFLLVGLLALIVVATPVAVLVRAQTEQQALDNALQVTRHVADDSIRPFATPELLAGDPAAIDELDAALLFTMENHSIMRIKVWDLSGTILYSDVPALVGRSFDLPVKDLHIEEDWPGVASIGVQNALDNEFESRAGELVEVYAPTEATDGSRLIVEAYYDDDAVREDQTTALLGIAPLFVASLAALQLAQLVPAIGLARRIQLDGRRRSLQETIDASERERRRIARELHDDVIQELAGLAYAFEAEKMHGSASQSAFYEKAHKIVQQNIGTLRAMTNELYPPDVEELGLPTALVRLAEQLLSHGIEVRIDVPNDIDLDRSDAGMFYRVAREVFTNVVKHAKATGASLSLTQDEEHTVMLIHDNGRGFDPAAHPPAGHLGLRIVRDSLRAAGGTLEVTSEAGVGTRVVTRLDRRAKA